MFKSAHLETCEVPFEQEILLGRFFASHGAARLETSPMLEWFFQYLLQSRMKRLSNNIFIVHEAQSGKGENITKFKGSKSAGRTKRWELYWSDRSRSYLHSTLVMNP